MFENQRNYLHGELNKEKTNIRKLEEELKSAEAKFNQLIGALDAIDVIEREMNEK